MKPSLKSQEKNLILLSVLSERKSLHLGEFLKFFSQILIWIVWGKEFLRNLWAERSLKLWGRNSLSSQFSLRESFCNFLYFSFSNFNKKFQKNSNKSLINQSQFKTSKTPAISLKAKSLIKTDYFLISRISNWYDGN